MNTIKRIATYLCAVSILVAPVAAMADECTDTAARLEQNNAKLRTVLNRYRANLNTCNAQNAICTRDLTICRQNFQLTDAALNMCVDYTAELEDILSGEDLSNVTDRELDELIAILVAETRRRT